MIVIAIKEKEFGYVKKIDNMNHINFTSIKMNHINFTSIKIWHHITSTYQFTNLYIDIDCYQRKRVLTLDMLNKLRTRITSILHQSKWIILILHQSKYQYQFTNLSIAKYDSDCYQRKEFGLVKLRTSMIPKLREISQITGNFFQSGNFQADGRTHTQSHSRTVLFS